MVMGNTAATLESVIMGLDWPLHSLSKSARNGDAILFPLEISCCITGHHGVRFQCSYLETGFGDVVAADKEVAGFGCGERVKIFVVMLLDCSKVTITDSGII